MPEFVLLDLFLLSRLGLEVVKMSASRSWFSSWSGREQQCPASGAIGFEAAEMSERILATAPGRLKKEQQVQFIAQ